MGSECKEGIAHQRKNNPPCCILSESSFPKLTGPLQPTDEQAHRQEHEIGSRSRGDMQHLLTVYGQVVTQYAEAETEQGDIHCHQPSPGKEKAVERQMG